MIGKTASHLFRRRPHRRLPPADTWFGLMSPLHGGTGTAAIRADDGDED
jgi:hypothetical protein